jgi:hypothetical protein
MDTPLPGCPPLLARPANLFTSAPENRSVSRTTFTVGARYCLMSVLPRPRDDAVVTDNVISHQREMAGFVDYVRSRSDAHSVQIPLRAGVEWTVQFR